MKLHEAVLLSSLSVAGMNGCELPSNESSLPMTSSVTDVLMVAPTNSASSLPISDIYIIPAPERGIYQGSIGVCDGPTPKECSPKEIAHILNECIQISLRGYSQNKEHIDAIHFSCCPNERSFVGIDASSGPGDSKKVVPIYRDTCSHNKPDGYCPDFYGALQVFYGEVL